MFQLFQLVCQFEKLNEKAGLPENKPTSGSSVPQLSFDAGKTANALVCFIAFTSLRKKDRTNPFMFEGKQGFLVQACHFPKL